MFSTRLVALTKIGCVTIGRIDASLFASNASIANVSIKVPSEIRGSLYKTLSVIPNSISPRDSSSHRWIDREKPQKQLAAKMSLEFAPGDYIT